MRHVVRIPSTTLDGLDEKRIGGTRDVRSDSTMGPCTMSTMGLIEYKTEDAAGIVADDL